jgi:hypothetical protein
MLGRMHHLGGVRKGDEASNIKEIEPMACMEGLKSVACMEGDGARIGPEEMSTLAHMDGMGLGSGGDEAGDRVLMGCGGGGVGAEEIREEHERRGVDGEGGADVNAWNAEFDKNFGS